MQLRRTISTTIALWGRDSRLVTSSFCLSLSSCFYLSFSCLCPLSHFYLPVRLKKGRCLELPWSSGSCFSGLRVPHTYLPWFLWHNLLHLQNHVDEQLFFSVWKNIQSGFSLCIFSRREKPVSACVRGVPMPLGCPICSETFLQGHSWNICNLISSTLVFPMRRSLSKFLLSAFIYLFPFHLIHLLIALVSFHINTIPCFFYFSFQCHSLVIYSYWLCLQLSSPPTVDDDRGRHFFSSSCSQCFHFFSFVLFCFLPAIQTCFVEMTARTYNTKAL